MTTRRYRKGRRPRRLGKPARSWWANLFTGRLWGRRRVHKYRGTWYSVAPSEAYRRGR